MLIILINLLVLLSKMFANMWRFIIYSTFLITIVTAGLYFPMSDIEVTIPRDKKRVRTLDKPIMTLEALREYDTGNIVEGVNYTQVESGLLDVNLKTGAVTFSRTFRDEENAEKVEQLPIRSAVTNFTGTVSAWDKEGNEVKTIITVNLDLTTSTDCELLTKELCYWKSVRYKLYENRRPTVIGSMSSPYFGYLCPDYKVNYKLLNGTNFISINRSVDSKQWDLKSLKFFERDIIRHHSDRPLLFGVGSRVYFGVKCTVSSPDGTEKEIDESLYITVLDENDNAPKPQFQPIEISLDDGATLQEKVEKMPRLIFIDRDTPQVNNYAYNILEDKYNIFSVKCTPFEDDREGEPQTAISCKLWARKNIEITESSYSIILQINDTSLLPGNGDSTVNVTINIHKNAMLRPQLPSPENFRKLLLYPDKVTILRYAAPFARVAQPKEINPNFHKFKIKHDSTTGGKVTGAFNVTYEGGIVYVYDINVLKESTPEVTLEIEWEDTTKKEKLSDIFTVHLDLEGSPTCYNIGVASTDWPHCGQYSTPNSCKNACGLGTGGSSSIKNSLKGDDTRCVWRGEKRPDHTSFTSSYSTCTPDHNTCPDSHCDPLERLHHLICPQDCTDEVLLTGIKNKKTGKGVKKAIGICTCHQASCSCGSYKQNGEGKKRKTTTISIPETTTEFTSEITSWVEKIPETNASAHKAIDYLRESTCGTTCLLGISGGIIFLLGAVTTIVACWRMSHGGKDNRRGRKYIDSVSSLSGLQPEYTDRTLHISPETLNLTFDMNRSITTNITVPKVMPVDPKWEFPREKLHIEQTLGEGEFGRVLRAKALNISGTPGYSTVAVKTLKEDARESELADLMSEYQLLKDVLHPNVIKLLGASTLPGGPVYLIIEFAEYGSLRNYLRRSRHLESEGRTPCTGAMLGALDSEPPMEPICKVKPKDILSFAWQVSKGMAYLTDMKLVHRDLAARNVLLAEGMVCKISDFGLTRDVYEDDNYLKRTKGRVPVKWMALESLSDHVYTSKSDVWSFGILLWELVTLGASPYPGIAVQNLFHLLKSGYRMERPDNCSPQLYKIMRCCWNDEPAARPTFRILTTKLEAMLADGVEYLDLTPKIVHNRTYFSGLPDAITPDDNEDTIGYGNLTFIGTENINLLSSPQNQAKSIESQKLDALWKRPESPKPSNTKMYYNEETSKSQELHHYESPIKMRPKPEGSKTPSNERPHSYLDMASGIKTTETEELLSDVKVSRVTSL